jgi:hypothetical protein
VNKLTLVLVLWFMVPSFSAFALTPMEYYNSLVAGADEPGFQDGAFDEALFNSPAGLAFDKEGNRLFVADQKNHRVRVIYLYENHRVETLVGSNTGGNADGPLSSATFKEPSAIASLPEDQLAVYDGVDSAIRLIDLKNNTVKTLAKNTDAQGWNLVYWPKDNSLYLSVPDKGRLQRLDLKSKQFSMVVLNQAELTQPKALCVYKDQLYVSDGKTSAIYRVEPAYNSLSAVTSADVRMEGQGDKIVAMTSSGDGLYALQGSKNPLVKILPDFKYQPVDQPTAWGFLAENESYAYGPLLRPPNETPSGFVMSPREDKKFFVTHGNPILSVKDYDFKEGWAARQKSEYSGSLTDFNYPVKKPPKTFRILITGNSMLVTAPLAFSDSDSAGHDMGSLTSHTLSKQLEFLLNTQAALKNVPEHYEVLNLGHPGRSAVFSANTETLELAAKYDVDMVILFVTPYQEEGFGYYYIMPITSEGIPSNKPDAEFLLKPLAERIPAGAPADLFERAKKKGKATVTNSNQISFDNGTFQTLLLCRDEGMRNDLLEMMGKPLRLASGKIGKLKTSGGQAVQFMVCFTPNDGADPLSLYESFWTDLCSQNKLPLLNLSKPFTDLKISFFPTMESCCHQHFTAYGNSLIAYLLSYYLPEQHWIPFTPDNVKKGNEH